MLKWLAGIWAAVFGVNAKFTPKDVIVDQLNEPRPLPIGVTEFHKWADRQISGAMLTCGPDEDVEVFKLSQKYCLANLILHLGPTESHKPDAFFIHSLHKFAANQVADAVRQKIFEERKKATADDEAKKKLELSIVKETALPT